MLKALELFGFKSFADKTRFEFPAGITVVVGPNGSGKSNIVDGIKWVLGEQSAKSLRGREMADVIFKGSGSVAGGRKPASAAEATVIFENADGKLPIDAPEVHITRRVYRSGEGEYLINRQPARLKDIRDMFRGTGVGVDAYSLIEQGKVDRLLQASAKDRRAIFEEAAGISRFKAKKIEAQRRLERVEQNLLRLADIVEEVESRLRSVRNQAAKAKRYREYSDRLQELRTQVALSDWRKLSQRLAGLETQLGAVQVHSADASAKGESLEAALLEVDTSLLSLAEQQRAWESQAAANREQIAQLEATIQQQLARIKELEEESVLHSRSLASMSDRAGDVRQRLAQTHTELAAAQQTHDAAAARLADHESQLAELTSEMDRHRRQADKCRQGDVTLRQSLAVLENRIEVERRQRDATQSAADEAGQQRLALEQAAAALAKEVNAAEAAQQHLAGDAAARDREAESLAQELSELRRLHAARLDDLSQLQTRRRGMSERASLLEELERTLEGLGAGVKEALAKIKGQTSGPLSLVRGVMADLIGVDVEHAAAIDVALGDAAQALVVEGGLTEVDAVARALGPLAGRVSLIATAEPDGVADAEPRGSSDEIGQSEALVGRASELIELPPQHAALGRRLLGNTWVVATRQDAIRFWRDASASRAVVVTLDGELLTADGAFSYGPRQSATSLISRRSELRVLRSELTVLAEQSAAAQSEVAALAGQIDAQELNLRQCREAAQAAARSLADARLAVSSLHQRRQQQGERLDGLSQTLADATTRMAQLAASITTRQEELAALQAQSGALAAEIAGLDAETARIEHGRQSALQAATAARVELARSEQRLESLQARLAQFEDDHREREGAAGQVRQQWLACRQRHDLAEHEVLSAESSAATCYLVKEQVARQLAELTGRRESEVARRAQTADEAQQLQKALRKLHEEQHQLELAAGQVQHERQTLLDRFREDYELDLSAFTGSQPDDPQLTNERSEVEAEIESLRRKIHQIGAVNLDALDELDELESRFAHLSGQHRDLSEAKQALERIIQKINADSRRLFTETLEAIRTNFQTLYRKAFGGGKADIVLEEGVDVLDAGVEILATPPGKPTFNNSLLSGGEKALTAVALLLAIFQFRPSPFCVLDEVDAPFDEANIGRFIDVLHDFLGWTKFIIVTHSKKTMTAATTLYGVTMQESGVSKRVSVRFDDVTDDGHIKQEAIDRQRGEEADERGVA